jgi:hypothetical protein
MHNPNKEVRQEAGEVMATAPRRAKRRTRRK